MVRIPSEYQEVEWIGTDGTGAYIDSEIECTSELSVDFGFEVLTNVNMAFCGGIGLADAPIYFRHHSSPSAETGTGLYWIQRNNVNRAAVNTYSAPNKRCELSIDPVEGLYTFRHDGTVETNTIEKITQHYTTGKSYGILGRIASDGTIQSRPSKIYYFKFYQNSVLIANFIPCYRKSDSEPGMYDTVTKQFFTNSGTGTFLVGNDVHYSTVNLMESRRRILLNTPHIKSLSGNALSFKTDVPFTLKECKIHFTPKQEGTGTPSPENVRPITGWDGIEVTRCGKNVWDEQWEVGNISDTTGANLNANDNIRSKNYIPICPNTSYYASNVIRRFYYDKDKNFLYYVGQASGLFTTPANAYYMRLRTYKYGTTYNNDISINYPATATSYEPYKGTTIDITFPSEAGTVYGGTLDVKTGELTVDMAMVDLGTLSWQYRGNIGTGIFSSRSITDYRYAANNCEAVCANYEYIGITGGVTGVKIGDKLMAFYFRSDDSSSNRLIYVRDTAYTDAASFESAMSGVQLVYELATPQTYQLTPETIRTLKGINNVFSNANGNIDVSFWSH